MLDIPASLENTTFFRTAILRERSRARMGTSAAAVASEDAEDEKSAVAAAAVASVTNKEGHVNFFMDLEAGETTHTDNKAWPNYQFFND